MTHSRTRALSLLITLMVVAAAQLALASSSSAQLWKVPAPDPSIDPLVELAEYENRIAFQVNKKRAAHELKPVRNFETCIDRMAERWAAHLADIGALVHRDLNKVLKACDLSWVGETLVSGTAVTPGAAVKAWMQSPPHRKVLMKPRARLAGVGTRLNGDGQLVTVLNFGDPA